MKWLLFRNKIINLLLYLIYKIVVAHEGDGGSNCKLSVVQRALKSPEKAIDRLKELFNLAYKYPNEVMIVKLESKLLYNTKNNGTFGWDRSLITAMLHSLIVELKGDQRAITFQENNPPTLGWCRQNQKNILITIEPRDQVCEELLNYTYYSYKVCGQVDWETDPLEDVKTGKVARGVTNNHDGSIWSPFLEIHLNPENSFKPDFQYRTKYNFYQHVKKRFLQYYHHCRKMPNFIVADFIDQGDVSMFVDDVNNNINENDGFKPELQKICLFFYCFIQNLFKFLFHLEILSLLLEFFLIFCKFVRQKLRLNILKSYSYSLYFDNNKIQKYYTLFILLIRKKNKNF